MAAAHHHTELEAWRDAQSLAVDVLRWITGAGKALPWPVRDQIMRAAISVPANIAEGFGRGTDPDFARFLDIARGSAHELDCLLRIASDLQGEPQALEGFIDRIRRVGKRIAGLTSYLRPGRVNEHAFEYDHGPRTTDHGLAGSA